MLGTVGTEVNNTQSHPNLLSLLLSPIPVPWDNTVDKITVSTFTELKTSRGQSHPSNNNHTQITANQSRKVMANPKVF